MIVGSGRSVDGRIVGGRGGCGLGETVVVWEGGVDDAHGGDLAVFGA